MNLNLSLAFIFLENKQLLQEAKLELKKSKRKDYYKILGVSKNVNEDEIKKAYKKRALIHHPGKVAFCSLLRLHIAKFSGSRSGSLSGS